MGNENTNNIYKDNPEFKTVTKLAKIAVTKAWSERGESDIRTKNLTRARFLQNFKNSMKYEHYLDEIHNRKHRVFLSKLRLSDHDLMIGKGRKLGLENESRICEACHEDIEIEIQLIFQYTELNMAKRNLFSEELNSTYQNFNKLDVQNNLLS